MQKIRITVMRKVCHKDLMEKYENPMENACDMEEGQVFIANGWSAMISCNDGFRPVSFLIETLDEEVRP